MNRLIWIGLIGALCAFLLSCHSGPKPFFDVPVSVNNCDTGADVTISISAMNQVKWTAVDSNYTLVFPPSGTSNPSPGTPFQNAAGQPVFSFPVNKGSTVASGPGHVKGYFKYNIYATAFAGNPPTGTAPCKDPGLHVKD